MPTLPVAYSHLRRSRNNLGADDAICTGPIVDDELLTCLRRELRRDDSRSCIGTTGAEADDDAVPDGSGNPGSTQTCMPAARTYKRLRIVQISLM